MENKSIAALLKWNGMSISYHQQWQLIILFNYLFKRIEIFQETLCYFNTYFLKVTEIFPNITGIFVSTSKTIKLQQLLDTVCTEHKLTSIDMCCK